MSLFHICEIVQIVFGSFQKISGMKIRKAILSCNMKGPHANVFLSWLNASHTNTKCSAKHGAKLLA